METAGGSKALQNAYRSALISIRASRGRLAGRTQSQRPLTDHVSTVGADWRQSTHSHASQNERR